MNISEFEEWWRFHITRFPSIESWLAKLENHLEILRFWQEYLQDVPISVAKLASQKLYGGSLKEPSPWDKLPATILEYYHHTAAPNKKICQDCGNKGLMEICSVVSGEYVDIKIACSCPIGRIYKINHPEVMNLIEFRKGATDGKPNTPNA